MAAEVVARSKKRSRPGHTGSASAPEPSSEGPETDVIDVSSLIESKSPTDGANSSPSPAGPKKKRKRTGSAARKEQSETTDATMDDGVDGGADAATPGKGKRKRRSKSGKAEV